MTQQIMPNAIPYSPIVSITNITDTGGGVWEITVSDITAFPDAPGLAVITSQSNPGYSSGDPTDYETIEYAEIVGSVLKQITREVEGTQTAWSNDDLVAPFWTAEAYKRFKENIEDLDTQLGAHTSEEATETDLGHVKVDNTTITAAGGVISAADVPNKVDKAGDTMTGTLAMSGETAITFGGKFKMVYNDALTTLDIEVIP